MKGLFFAYPSGIAGAALLLLRVSVAFWLIIQPIPFPLGAWPPVLAGLVAVMLCGGFGVRIVTGGLGLAILAMMATGGLAMPQHFVAHALDAFALALIGPGAYSVDALLFGRRTIRLG